MPKTGWWERDKKRDPTVHKGVFASDYHISPVIIRHRQGLFPHCIDFRAGKFKQKTNSTKKSSPRKMKFKAKPKTLIEPPNKKSLKVQKKSH